MIHRDSQHTSEMKHLGKSGPRSLLRRSVPGEYLSWALMLHAGLGCVVWMLLIPRFPLGVLFVGTGLWIILRAAGLFAQRRLTSLITVGFIWTVLAFYQADFASQVSPLAIYSLPIYLLMLGLVLVLDLFELALSPRVSAFAQQMRQWNWHRLAIGGFVLAFLIYMVAIPTTSWLLEWMYPPKSGVVIEMSFGDKLRLQAVEAVTTCMFFALGATVGSFLNVVVYRMPRGESVVFRPSRCPYCETQIASRDNIPILGWLLLGGRCRTCRASISPRYPTVEFLVALFFLILYFVELISGGANIPLRQPNRYHGVVWIIFYTKWDLVALYLYHCFALSVLLTWALIDVDRKRVPLLARCGVGAVLFALPAFLPDLLPVPWMPGKTIVSGMATWTSAMLTCGLGGLAGMLLGWLGSVANQVHLPGDDAAEHAVAKTSRRNNVVSSGMIVGMTVGWQAAIGVWLVTLALRPLVAGAARRWKFNEPALTSLVLVAYFVHLLAWRGLDVGWWPSYHTTPLAWCLALLAFVLLWGINRAVPLPCPRVEDLETSATDVVDLDLSASGSHPP